MPQTCIPSRQPGQAPREDGIHIKGMSFDKKDGVARPEDRILHLTVTGPSNDAEQ